MKTVRKVCAGVVRQTDGTWERLLFEHRHGGVQLPKGGLELGEEVESVAGVLRELEEETGVVGVHGLTPVGIWERHAGAGPTEFGPIRRHQWEVFLIKAPEGLPDEWGHARGSVAVDGLQFRCHWVPIDEHIDERLHPLSMPVVRMLAEAAIS